MMGYSLWNKPSEKEIQAQRQKQDSITAIQNKVAMVQKTVQSQTIVSDSVAKDSLIKKTVPGAFAKSSHGENKAYILENDVIKLQIDAKGGRIAQADLKKYI